MDVVKVVGKYLNTPVGTVCFNTDKVLTTVLDKENVEGFASIILRLATKSGISMSQVQTLLSYQWLEHLSMYANQAHANSNFALMFLQGFNKSLQKNTFLTGHHLTIADVAAYHSIYPMMERLSLLEQESLVHVCRWMKHLQSKPKATKPVPTWAREPLPKQLYPHELKDVDLTKPVMYFPQPFSFPGYPVILYL